MNPVARSLSLAHAWVLGGCLQSLRAAAPCNGKVFLHVLPLPDVVDQRTQSGTVLEQEVPHRRACVVNGPSHQRSCAIHVVVGVTDVVPHHDRPDIDLGDTRR